LEKLVRDNIPEIMQRLGKTFILRIVKDDDEFFRFLLEKLKEEVEEFAQSGNKEELADIFEVILEIMRLKGWSMKEIEGIRKRKLQERGGFSKRFVLRIL